MPENQNDIQTLAHLLRDIRFAMLTTTSSRDGSLRSRPMTLQQFEFDGELWFFGAKSTTPIIDLEVYPEVNLAFANSKDMTFVSIKGRAEVVEDRAKAEQLWSPAYKVWFPKGLEDPELTLFKVEVASADYWSSTGSKVVQLIGFAKAMLGAREGSQRLGEKHHIDLPTH